MKHNTDSMTYESPIVAFNNEPDAEIISVRHAHFLDYIHGLVPISRTRDVVATTQVSDVVAAVTTTSKPASAFDSSRSATTVERPPLPFGIDIDHRDNHRSLSFVLSAMEKRFGIRTRFLDVSEAPPAASTATTSWGEAPSSTSFASFAGLRTPTRPFFEDVSDTNIPAFTTAFRPASLAPTALSIAPTESMHFEQIPNPAEQPPISQPAAKQLSAAHIATTPLWPLWILLPLITVLTIFAILVYYKLVLREASKRSSHAQELPRDGGHSYDSMSRTSCSMDLRRNLHLRNVPPSWRGDDISRGYAVYGDMSGRRFSGMQQSTGSPSGRSVSQRYGAVLPELCPAASSTGVVHRLGTTSAVDTRVGTRFAVDQSQCGDLAKYPRKQHIEALGSGAWSSVALPVSTCSPTKSAMGGFRREQEEVHHLPRSGLQIKAACMSQPTTMKSPVYATGTSLASPHPQNTETPQTRNAMPQPFSFHTTAAQPRHPTGSTDSQLRLRKNQPPSLYVDTTLANDEFRPNHTQAVDLESQMEGAPAAVNTCSRSWLSLPMLNRSSHADNSTSSSILRTHSRSSSTSSLLSNIVNGVAEKLVNFTNDTGGPEHGLLLPISARDRQEADEIGGEVQISVSCLS